MSSKGHSPEQIVGMLREVDVALSQGQTVAKVSRTFGVTSKTIYRWRKMYRRLRADQVKRLKELENENSSYKSAVEDGGVEAPFDKSSKNQISKNRVYGETEEAVVDNIFEVYSENITLREVERQIILLMAVIAQNKLPDNKLKAMIPRRHQALFDSHVAPAIRGASKVHKERGLVITFHMLGICDKLIAEFTTYSRNTVQQFVREYNNGEHERLLCKVKKERGYEKKENRDKVFELLHVPPKTYGINRTTWTLDLLHDVLKEEGTIIARDYIQKIIRSEGYVFRRTREVLTSNDPDYKEKLKAITRTLRRLAPKDMFFSIDEYGPISIRERVGRRRVLRGEIPTVPQYQDSKGHIILIAALELKTNQITYFYGKRKSTDEMINLMLLLLETYHFSRRLYFSWDAAIWHSSRKFLAKVKMVNSKKYREIHGNPTVILKPLPARAQFLNVIESVFSGLSKSIIQNSNYGSVREAQEAIDRYINERNLFFRKNPKKAGNKIWGKEQTPSYFSVSHNCKNPQFAR